MLSIGDVKIDHPFVQAALSGYSDLPMRRIARAHGASYTINEVVLDRCVLYESDWQRQLLTVHEDDHPVGAQLMGSEPTHFGPAARMLADAGYDVIDINFGCPAAKVVDRCRAGYLLGQPKTALDIVTRVMDAVGRDKPITVKMRRGLDDSPESERNFFRILDGALGLGISAVVVHGRTVVQKYKGPSQWSSLRRIKRHVGNAIVLGSGDLFSAADCIAMMEQTGVDGVTIARGAIGYPWIFRECLALASGDPLPPSPSLSEQRDTIERHLAEALRAYDERVATKMLCKFGIRYSKLHPKAKRVREAFNDAKGLEGFQHVLDTWYPSDHHSARHQVSDTESSQPIVA